MRGVMRASLPRMCRDHTTPLHVILLKKMVVNEEGEEVQGALVMAVSRAEVPT